MRLPKRDDPASVHLDALRATAAFLVLVSHARNLFVKSAGEATGHVSALGRLFYLVTKQGHSAVVVFFVLSGFLIGTSVLSQFGRGSWSAARYAVARLSRLWVVLLPALILGLTLDLLGSHLFPDAAVYTVPNYAAMMPLRLAEGFTPLAFLGNVLFLQTIFVPTLGTNGALWSLANEFWYYVLFPAGVLLVWKDVRAPVRIIGLVVLVAVLAMLPNAIRALFPIWLMGAALALVPRVKVPSAFRWASGLLVVGFLVLSGVKTIPYSEFALGLLTTAFVYCLLAATRPVSPLRARVSGFASDISYSLYLAHTPFLVIVAAATMQGGRLDPGLAGTVFTLAVSGTAIAYAALVWWLFERNTERVRRWASALLGWPALRAVGTGVGKSPLEAGRHALAEEPPAAGG